MRRQALWLHILAASAGFASMSLELAAVRALAPFFGASVFVWTHVLGVVLAALSLGYFVAGKLADGWQNTRALAWTLILGSGLAAFSPFLAQGLASIWIPSDLRLEHSLPIFWGGSLAVAVLAFGPPAFLLSFTSPTAIRFLASQHPVGEISGRIFALSTAGSILGTFLTTYLLVPWIGTRATFVVAGLMVLIPALALLFLEKNAPETQNKKMPLWTALLPWLALIPLACIAGSRSLRPWGLGRVLEERDTLDQFVQLRQEGDQRWIQVNEGLDSFQSMWVEGKEWTGAYYDYFLLAPAFAEIPRGASLSVCVLGLGGGSASRLLHLHEASRQHLRVEGIEVDAGLVEMAREHFALGPAQQTHLRVHAGRDARVFLAQSQDLFDVILLDAYAAQLQIPFHLASLEFFELVFSRLREGGVFAINVGVFRDPGFSQNRDSALDSLAATAAQAFGEAYGLPVPKTRNVILFCRKGKPLPGATSPELTQERPYLRELLAVAAAPGAMQVWKRNDPGNLVKVLTDDHSALEMIQARALWEAPTRGRP